MGTLRNRLLQAKPQIAHQGPIVQTIRIKQMIQRKSVHHAANRQAVSQFCAGRSSHPIAEAIG